MKTIEVEKNKLIIEFSKSELVAICNALSEVCSSIEVSEFDVKMGVKTEEVRRFLSAFGLACKELKKITIE